MKTATLIKILPKDLWVGEARLYKLSHPLEGHRRVIVSAVNLYVTETYIFPAGKDDCPSHWGELRGSYKGGTSHERALELAGYVVK